jgi:hypothetical protein
MNRELLRGAVIIALLLSIGTLIGRNFKPMASSEQERDPFRAWFWEQRTFDLLAQVGLIFAGALGVAAILPQARSAERPQEGRPQGAAPTGDYGGDDVL